MLNLNEADPIDALAMRITRELKESHIYLAHHVVRVLGIDAAQALLARTLETVAAGGMKTIDGTRNRTPGGVFFFLARAACTPEQKAHVFPMQTRDQIKARKKRKKQQQAPAINAPVKDIKQKGTAVKITLVGRPATSATEKDTCVSIVMQSAKIPALPKGLPEPKAEPTNYVCYISTKQWKAVAAAILDPDDVLILEGFPQVNAANGSIKVFVMNCTTKKQQQAKKETQKSNAS